MIALLNHHIFKYTLVLIVSAITLQSCFVAKTYERPQVEDTENLFRTDALPADSLSMADVSWKEMFTDPYLVQYIEEGLQNNIDIRVAIQQMIAAEAYVKQGKAGYFPSLSAGGTFTHQELSRNSQFGSFFNGAIDQYAVTADLSWEADIWGKIRSNKRAFEDRYLQRVRTHQSVKTRLIEDIYSTYYKLLPLDAQLAITKRSVTVRESSDINTQA
mgnify:CR=1 FL=1